MTLKISLCSSDVQGVADGRCPLLHGLHPQPLCHRPRQVSTVQYSTVQYSTVQYSTASILNLCAIALDRSDSISSLVEHWTYFDRFMLYENWLQSQN